MQGPHRGGAHPRQSRPARAGDSSREPATVRRTADRAPRNRSPRFARFWISVFGFSTVVFGRGIVGG